MGKFSRLGLGALAISALCSSAALADQKSYDYKDFDKISVSAGVEAVIAVGGDYSVNAESSAEGLERLEIRLRGRELHIGRESRFMSFGRQPNITVRVTLPKLAGLDVSSGSETRASGVKGGDFEIDASSGAGLTIEGECDALELDISSGADVDAHGFKCKSARADASSGSDAEINVSDSITADASSGASVKVYGEPKSATIEKSSGGSVTIVK